MVKKALSLCILLLLAASPRPAASGVDFEPGLWEVTSRLAMPGMRLPAASSRECLGPEAPVPEARSGRECSISEVAVSGSTVRWSVRCSGEYGLAEGRGRATYLGESFEGTIALRSQGLDMIMSLQGRRLHDSL